MLSAKREGSTNLEVLASTPTNPGLKIPVTEILFLLSVDTAVDSGENNIGIGLDLLISLSVKKSKINRQKIQNHASVGSFCHKKCELGELFDCQLHFVAYLGGVVACVKERKTRRRQTLHQNLNRILVPCLCSFASAIFILARE